MSRQESGGSGENYVKLIRDTCFLYLNSNHSVFKYKFFATPKLSVGETDRNDLYCKLIVNTGEEIISAIY